MSFDLDLDLDLEALEFIDFVFKLEGSWDDPTMGITEPDAGVPDELEVGPQPFPYGPASTAS